MPRTNYIFIDTENVHEKDLSRIKGKSAVVHLVLGANVTKPPKSIEDQLEEHAEKIVQIRTPSPGKNHLDFVLTCELGMRVEKDPEGYFHIISKDRDYNVVVQHLKAKKILIAQRKSLSEVPALFTTEERYEKLLADLRSGLNPRPVKRKTLESTIQRVFERGLTDQVIDRMIRLFIHKRVFEITKTGKVVYPTP